MFHHIMEKVRSRQEIEAMRRNVLAHKLQIYKKMDSIVAVRAIQGNTFSVCYKLMVFLSAECIL